MARIEAKLDALIDALADEQVEQEEQSHIVTLDGDAIPCGERDQTQSLD